MTYSNFTFITNITNYGKPITLHHKTQINIAI